MATIRLVEDLSGFEGLRSRWDCLVSQNPSLRVFQTFEWNYNGWIRLNSKEPGARLFIIHAERDGHEEEAIFPFYVDGRNILRFIADKLADTPDAVYPAHTSNWHTFYHDVARFINERKDVLGIELAKLDSQSELLAYFKSYCPDTIIEYHDTYSLFHTEKGNDISTGFPQLNSKERSYLRSLMKRYPDYSFSVYSKEAGLAFPREKIVTLRNWMVENGYRVLQACPDVTIDLMGDMYEAGLCEVAVLAKDGVFGLASYRLVLGEHVNFWMVFYKEPPMTTVADAKYVVGKLNEGSWDFDFGTGAYSYKLGTFRPRVFHLFRLRTKRITFFNLLHDLRMSLRIYVKNFLVVHGFIRRRR